MEVVAGGTLSGARSSASPSASTRPGSRWACRLIGPDNADLAVLQLAFAYDQVTQFVKRNPPPLLRAA